MALRLHLLRLLTTILLLVSHTLTACDTPTPVGPGKATVERIDILLMESFLVQIRVVVKGNLPDDCTAIDEINQGDDPANNAFWIEITTRRSPDEPCTESPVPFGENIPLDVYGLPASIYTVELNDMISSTFTLDIDNILR